MKKLFVLLVMLVLAIFIFSGCQGLVPSEGEGEGEGEMVTEGVTVDIEDAAKIDNKTYLSGGSHEITVTFPSPVEGWVKGNITPCNGDYRDLDIPSEEDTDVIFYPNEDRTVWTGSGSFGNSLTPVAVARDRDLLCCASYLQITSGECEDEICINIPVIVDSEPPYATIELCMDDCACGGCELSFSSTVTSSVCSEDTTDCGDDCSGLAGWSIALYEEYPFDTCCEIPCEEPVFTCSGTECPIQCTTDCLTEESYYAIVTLTDHTENEVRFGTGVEIDPENCETLSLTELNSNDCLDNPSNSGFVVCEELAVEKYVLSMEANPSEGGTATDETNSGPYAEDTGVSISAEHATGYEFLYWMTPGGTYDANFADANSASTTFTMPAEDVTVTARFLDVVQNNKTYTEGCNIWTAFNVAGGVGITIDIWDISSIPTGSTIDMEFDAYGIPDRWFIYYNGSLVYETGWRGNSSYDGNPLYPGGVTSPVSGQILPVIANKLAGVDELEIRVEGADSSTASQYRLRSNCP